MRAQQLGWSTSIRGGSLGDTDKPGIVCEPRGVTSERLSGATNCRHPWALPSNVNHPLTALLSTAFLPEIGNDTMPSLADPGPA
jgi:hypothetical protein